jgi:hypothetical protein
VSLSPGYLLATLPMGESKSFAVGSRKTLATDDECGIIII